jgi:hypothetical protein
MCKRIEKLLEKASGSMPFYKQYALLKYHLFLEYDHWAAGFRYGNNHGREHIRRVLEKLEQLLGTGFLPKVITEYELFLTMMAILYHDVGVLRAREDHAATSGQFLDEDSNTYVIDKLDKEIIRAAVVSHSSTKKIDQECAGLLDEENIGAYTARPRVVAALVRLADELDEDFRRGNPQVAQRVQIPAESEFFWEFCQRVISVRPDRKKLNIKITVKFEPEDLGRQAELKKEPRLFIVAFAEKLAKINGERAYLSSFLPEPLKYKELVVAVRPLAGAAKWKKPRQFIFDDNTGVHSFIKAFPELVEEPARQSLGVIREAIRAYKLEGAHTELSRLESVLEDLPSEIHLDVLWDLAIVCSLEGKEHSTGTADRVESLRGAVEYLKRWYELGKKSAWQELRRDAAAEIYKITTDMEMGFLYSEERKHIEEMLGTDAKCLVHSWHGGGGGCLPEGVAVESPSGAINIEDLRMGMAILSCDFQVPPSKIETRVLRTYRSSAETCIRINDKFLVTESQPLYLGAGKWINGGELVVGSRLQIADGSSVAVETLEKVKNCSEVYTLTTDHPTHNFLVSGLICGNKKK